MPAFSSAASGGESGSLSLLILVLPLALLAYLIFAQRRRARREAKVQQELQVGDAVMSRAGMFGVIASLEGPVVRVEVAPGVVLTFDRRAVIPGTVPGEEQAQSSDPSDPSDAPDSPDADQR